MRVGIVADDLTGAMDSAAPFADRGIATRVLFSAAGDAEGGCAPAVLAIDTDSRELPADAAARAVQAGVTQISADRLPFKKIDSTLRANVAAEIAAALQASGRRCALVAPSVPAQGRVLRDGYLFVNGQKVGATSLTQMLRQALPGVPVRALRPGDAIGDGPCVLVADAETEQDLARIGAVGLDDPGKFLLVGAAGLASALASDLRSAPAHSARPTYERLVFVVGSYNERSAEQVRTLLAQRKVETLVLTPDGALRGTVRGDGRVLLLHVEGLGAAPTLDPRWVAARLAGATADLLATQGEQSTALFITGGDTARAVLSQLRVDAIDVIGNLFPGIVHGSVMVARRPLGVVTKAGGFGATDVFVEAMALMLRDSS